MPSKISTLTPVLQAELDDTAALEVTNRLGQTRKSTIAQLRTAIVAGVLVAAHLMSPVIDSGGLTITSGTLGAQAVTATALTVTPGATSLQALTAGATSVTTLAGTGAVSGFTTAAFSSTLTAGSSTDPVKIGGAGTYGMVTLNSLLNTATGMGIFGRINGAEGLYLNTPTGTTFTFSVNGVSAATLTSSTLTVSAGTTAVQALTTAGNITLTTASAPTLTVANSSGNDAYVVLNGGAGTTKNWRCGKDVLTSGAFEIQASTANGGSTYTTSLVTLTPAALTVSAGTTAVQALTATSAVVTNATAGASIVIDPTAGGAGDNSQVIIKRNGVTKWQIGNNVSLGGDVFEIYSAVAAGYALQISPTTKVVTMSGGMSTTTGDLVANTNALSRAVLKLIDTYAVAGTQQIIQFQRNNIEVGSITTTLAATAYVTSSDKRLKKDRGVATDPSVLRAIVIHDFEWKVDGTVDRGVFAQEAAEVRGINPHAIHRGDTKRSWGVDYSKFVPDLIVGWQAHDASLQDHESRLLTLERRAA